jgi:death-on-curing protein
MKKLNLKEVEYTAFRLARETLSFNEPIPDFSTRYPHKLESCIAMPFQTFSGRSMYKGLIGKASILLYLMIKNHPFLNGNKRIAMTTLFVFLHKNGKWLKVDAQELYNFTIWITASPPGFKDETLKAIEKFLSAYIVDL